MGWSSANVGMYWIRAWMTVRQNLTLLKDKELPLNLKNLRRGWTKGRGALARNEKPVPGNMLRWGSYTENMAST